MSEPQQKPGRSKQDYETPWPVVWSIQRALGEDFAWDLAASEANKKAPKCFTEADNSLRQDWHKLGGLLWLNPPFADLGAWAEKCAAEAALCARIVMLSPASVSTEWYAEHAHGVARVLFLRPRITFVGADQGYPKDLMLTLWGMGRAGEYTPWSWMTGHEVRR